MMHRRRLPLYWIPAKAGTYLPAVRAEEAWIPACAGTYSGAVVAPRA
jgi:hypothetical protein